MTSMWQFQAMDAVASNMGLDSARLGVSAPSLSLPTATMGAMSLSMVNPQIAAMNTYPGSSQLRKCGLPRDAEGRPIKAMSQLTGGSVVAPPSVRVTVSRDRSRSPRRSRGRSRSRSRGRRSRSRDRGSRLDLKIYQILLSSQLINQQHNQTVTQSAYQDIIEPFKPFIILRRRSRSRGKRSRSRSPNISTRSSEMTGAELRDLRNRREMKKVAEAAAAIAAVVDDEKEQKVKREEDEERGGATGEEKVNGCSYIS